MDKAFKNIFEVAQRSSAAHPKLIRKLINVYLKCKFEKFCSQFIMLMQHTLIHGEKSPIIERTLSFIAKFATSVKSEEQEPQSSTDNSEQEEEEDIDPFLVTVFEFLLKNHEASSKAVRYRVCQLINKVLNFMGEQASIDDSLYSKIYDTMLQRLMDKIPAVRVQAIYALSRLQDPPNKECPVIKAYLFHLSMDPSPDVRKAVLLNIAITFYTLPDILERRRDKRDFVRRQAYLLLAQKVHVRSFTIAQRVMIISEGLKDRSPIVRQVVKKNILQAWLRLVDGSVLDLLKCLDIEASTDSAELALGCLFEDVPYSTLLENFDLLDDNKLIPFEKLNTESAFYWRCLAKHLRSENAEEYLDVILPDLSVFCDYLHEYFTKDSPEDEDPQETAVRMMEKEFVCQQLIMMATHFDMADEVGRKSLCSLVHRLFISPTVGDICIKALSDVLSMLYTPAARIDELVEIISEIREPTEVETANTPATPKSVAVEEPQGTVLSEDQKRKNKLLLAQISVKMNQIQEELESCVRDLDLERAIPLKNSLKKLEEEKTNILKQGIPSTPVVPSSQVKMPDDDDEEVKILSDPVTLTRCLLILSEVLTNSDIKDFGSILRSLHDNLLLPCLKSEDIGVRRLAVKGLSLCCLISKELAKQHLLLLIEISRRDVEQIQAEGLQGLFDIWLLYGVEEFNSTPEDVKEANNFNESRRNSNAEYSVTVEDSQTSAAENMITLLKEMLEDKSSGSRTLVAGGICKLMFASQINSPELLSQLILLWYTPDTEDDQMLRHMLGVFFPLYASDGESHQENLSKALIPTLHTIFKAPSRSRLSDIDMEDVITFITSITNPSVISTNIKTEINAHESLAIMVCAEVIAHPDRGYVRALVRSLTQMNLMGCDFNKLKQIHVLARKITEKVSEKSTVKYAEKFYQSIKNLLLNENGDETLKNDEDTTKQELVNSCDNILLSERQQRRKRILYNTQNDFELVSNLDSETDRTPTKIKKRDLTSKTDSTLSSDVSSITSATEMNDEDLEELKLEQKENEETEDEKQIQMNTVEFELTSQEFTVREELNESSEDLFASPHHERESNEMNTPKTNGDDVENRNSFESSDIFNTSSSGNSVKTAETTIKNIEKNEDKEKKSSAVEESLSTPISTPSLNRTLSSTSFYSARSSSKSPEVSPPKRRKKAEKTFTDPSDGKKKKLYKSIEIQVRKLKTTEIPCLRSSPRSQAGRSSVTRSLRSSSSSSTEPGSHLKDSVTKSLRSNRKRPKESYTDDSPSSTRPDLKKKIASLSLKTPQQKSTILTDSDSVTSLFSTPSLNLRKRSKLNSKSPSVSSSSRSGRSSCSFVNVEASESWSSETRSRRKVKVINPVGVKTVLELQSLDSPTTGKK